MQPILHISKRGFFRLPLQRRASIHSQSLVHGVLVDVERLRTFIQWSCLVYPGRSVLVWALLLLDRLLRPETNDRAAVSLDSHDHRWDGVLLASSLLFARTAGTIVLLRWFGIYHLELNRSTVIRALCDVRSGKPADHNNSGDMLFELE